MFWLLSACGAVEEARVGEIVTAVATEAVISAPANTVTPTRAVFASATAVLPTAVLPTAVLPTATLLPTPTPSPTPQSRPTATHYTLWAAFDPATYQVAVTQTITYVNKTDTTLTTLPLLVEPARMPGLFNLHHLAANDGKLLAYEWQNTSLVITLPTPLPPHGYALLHLAYTLALPAQKSDFGYTSRQANLGNWYPMVPPYRESVGWVMHEPANVGEHLVYGRADYDVYLQISPPDPTLLLAAAGAQGAHDGWQHYQLRQARNFAWSVGQYATETMTVDQVQITAYTFPEDTAVGHVPLQTTVQALTLFNKIFAPYPHQTLALVEADFRDGMEFDSLYFLDQGLYQRYNGTPREYLIPIAAHETAHQWWQGVVGSDQAQEPWLDEALTTYSELLFYEHYYPDLVDWWWHFRVNRFEPTGNVGSVIYEFERFRPYVNTVYLRGALLLHEMRQLVGDDHFLAFLRAYAQAGQLTEQLTAADFWRIWQETTFTDASELWQHYFAD